MEGDLRFPGRRQFWELLSTPSLFLATVVTLTAITLYRVLAYYREYSVRFVNKKKFKVPNTERFLGGYQIRQAVWLLATPQIAK